MADWPEGIDIDALLAPIGEEAPSGEDLREDLSAQSTYFRLRDARAEARAAERQADADPAAEFPMPAQWRQVRDLSLQALSTRSKDLEVAAWLTEALVRSDGPRGLAAGARLIAGLAEAFWDSNLYPMPDEDGIATRVAPVTGLNGEGGDGTLAQPLRKLALFRRPDGAPLAFWQWAAAEEVKTLDAARAKQRLAGGVLPLDTLETEARAAGQAHFAAMRRALRSALAEWSAMGAVLDAKAGMDGPPTSAVRKLLEDILAVVTKFAPAHEEVEEAAAVADEATPETVAEAGGAAGPALRGTVGTVVNREDMLKELGRIAEFFRKTEPQSPLAYTLNEAIRRGRMSWPDLLAELVADTAVRDGILVQLGIRPQSGEEPPAS